MINPLKILFNNATQPIKGITQVIGPLWWDSESTFDSPDSPKIISPKGDPKYYQGLLQLQKLSGELNKGLSIDAPYDLLSKKDRDILLALHALERKYCRFHGPVRRA